MTPETGRQAACPRHTPPACSARGRAQTHGSRAKSCRCCLLHIRTVARFAQGAVCGRAMLPLQYPPFAFHLNVTVELLPSPPHMKIGPIVATRQSSVHLW